MATIYACKSNFMFRKNLMTYQFNWGQKQGKMVCKTTGFWELTYCCNHPRNRTTLTKHSKHYFPPIKCLAIRSPRKCYQNLLSGQGIFSLKKDRFKLCGHLKFLKVPENDIKTFKSFQSTIISHPKDRYKMCGHPQFSSTHFIWSVILEPNSF